MTIDRDLVADEIARMKEYNEKEVEYRTLGNIYIQGPEKMTKRDEWE